MIGDHIWINGGLVRAEQAQISPSDRGFTLGDGLFETMLWTGDKVRFVDDHMARLACSADALGIALLVPVDAIAAGLAELGRDAERKPAALRLTLTRGSGPRGLAISENASAFVLATIAPHTPPTQPANLAIVAIKRNSGAPSALYKTLSYIDNIIALKQARALGADEAIVLGTTGNVACASSANIIIEYEGRALTPAIEDGALPGIVRGRLIKSGLVEVANISPAMLANCTQGALTNALVGVRGIAALDKRPIQTLEAWLTQLRSAL
jgi:branched-chain amino acid aminotransferase